MTSRRERPPSGRNNVTARGEGLPRYAQVRFLFIMKLLLALWLVLMRLNSFASGYSQCPTSNSTEYGKIHQLTTKYCRAQCTILRLGFVNKWDSTTNERIERSGEECKNDRWDSCIGRLQLVLSTKIILCECLFSSCLFLLSLTGYKAIDCTYFLVV